MPKPSPLAFSGHALLAAVLLLSATLLPLPAQAQAPTRHRVVFALLSPDEADWKLTLGNLNNLLAGLPPNSTEIEVVAYGPGIFFEKKGSSAAAGIAALSAKNVRFVACENSMRAQHLTAQDLLPGITPTPSGIVEVIRKQEQGWSYIKAGR